MTATSTVLSLLGGFLLTVDGERRDVPGRKVKALICRLAFDDEPLSRDSLSTLLWPDSSPAAARHSLRQALTDVRRALQGSAIGLTVTSREAALETYGGAIDVRDFRALAAGRDPEGWQQAMSLYRGALLEGLDLRLDTFDQWLDQARGALTQMALELCRLLADRHEDDVERCIDWTRRLLALDPLDEAGHRDLMRLYIASDQDAAAIRQYLHCRSLLERELGIAPHAETTALYQGLLTHRAAESRDAGAGIDGRLQPEAFGTAPAAAVSEPARRLRPAVVLACQLAETDADPERADTARGEQLARLTRVVRSYGGRLVAHAGGQVVCGFGLDRVRGTEADRACLAASDLVGEIAGLRCGIASGQVIFRPEDGSLVGAPATEAQTLAARAAAGEVLSSDAVTAARRYGGDPAPPGAAGPAVAEPDAGSVPLVGRAMELRQFMALLDASRDGGYGCAVLLRGEAGIGKTRLVEEYATLATREGFAVHSGRAYDFGTPRGQDAIALVVRSLLGGATDAGSLAARAGAPHVPYLQAVLGMEPDRAAAELDSLSPDERLRRSTEAVVSLVRMVARGSALLLVVDDLHWADRFTLAVLPQLARAAADLPVVLVMTSRVAGEALDPEWRAAMGSAPLVTLDLQPLRQADAGRLANAFGAGAAGLNELLARAGGNPLFIQQLVRGAGLGHALPHSIQSLAVAQLEALPETVQAALRAASTLGQHFSAEALQATLGEEPDLEAAVQTGLVGRAEGGWRFHHALIRDGIYHNVLPSERRWLHARAAGHFRDRSLSLHAQHLDLADSDQAVPALVRAATDEIDHYRLSRAGQLVHRALEREPDEPRATLIDAQLELMLGNTGRAAEGFRTCLRRADTESVRAHALVGLGMALNQMDDYVEAEQALGEAVSLNGDDATFQADAWLQLGNVLFPQGRTDACLHAHQTSLEHAVRAGSTLRQARAEGGLGDAYYQQGAMLTAHRRFDRCVRLGESHGHAGVVPANLAMRGITLLYQNRLREALADGERALALAEQSSNLRHQLLAHNVLAGMESFHGNFDAGMEHARRTLELGERIGSRRFVLDARAQMAHLLWNAGRSDEARRTLDAAERLLDAAMLPFSGAYIRGLQALCAAQPRLRRAYLAEGERLLDRDAVSHCHLYFHIAAMDACLMAGEAGEALRFAELLTRYTANEPLPFADFYIRRAGAIAGAVGERAALADEARRAGLITALRLLEVKA